MAIVNVLYVARHHLFRGPVPVRRPGVADHCLRGWVSNSKFNLGQTNKVAAIRHISHSCLDPTDFTVVNCIVKGHVSLSPPSLRLRLCSRFTLLATTYFDPKDFSPHPSTVSKVMRPFHPLLNKKQREKK
ncbi:uncharacterized protein TNCV_1582261 [Trichonephila clavipes]|nr:uncharacterized protein TNCV_1582261 [Trichonephila clavipes]